jgi:acyl-CoA thioester hydrolase
MPRWIETAARVRWGECDLQGHAYYGSYVPWCDLGREELGLALGIDYVKYTLMTTNFSIRFHRPAKYLDELRIRCWATAPTARLDVHYQIYRKLGNQLLAEAQSSHALVGEKGLKLVAPKEFHEKFEAFLAGKPVPGADPRASDAKATDAKATDAEASDELGHART